MPRLALIFQVVTACLIIPHASQSQEQYYHFSLAALKYPAKFESTTKPFERLTQNN